jgi:hypothetical protein
MTTRAWLLWPVIVVAVLGHVGLGVLAAVEYVRLGWLASEPYELTAVTAVAASATLVVAGAARASSSTTAGSSTPVPTPHSSPAVASTPRCTTGNSAPKPPTSYEYR